MESNTYVIGLDAIDLNLLPTKYIQGNGMVPLWSKSNLNFREKEYYEFVIKTEDKEALDEENNVIENVVCHICDMDVPKAFMKDHRNSFKHEFNMKIADVALKRLQRHMNEREEDAKTEETTSKFYCQECSIIVNFKDEAAHKKSIVHKNSMFLQSFLRDFLQFYTNDDTLYVERDVIETQAKKDFKHTKSDVVKNEILLSKIDKKTVIEDINQLNESTGKDVKNVDTKKDLSKIVNDEIDTIIMKSIEKDLLTTDDESKKAVWKDVLEQCISNKKPNMNCDEYLRQLKQKIPAPMTLKVEDDAIVVKTMDGGQLRVYEEAFYGLNIFLFNAIRHCAVCKQAFALKNRDRHLKSAAHMKLMVLPLEDKHCVRKISDSTHHCVLCNEVFDNYFPHINSEKHRFNLKQKLISVKTNNNNEITDESDANLNKGSNFKLYNEVLKSSSNGDSQVKATDPVRADATPSTSSDAGDKANRRFCNFCNVWISTKKVKKHENTNKHIGNTISDYHYMIKTINADSVQCKICDVYLSNTVQDLNLHFKGPEHNKAYVDLLTANNVIKAGKTFSCLECNENILFKNEILHIESKTHQNRDDNPLPRLTTTLVEALNNASFKSEEDTKVPIVEQENATSKSHFCTVCKVEVPNNVNNIKMHEQGRNHLRNLELLNVNNVSNVKEPEVTQDVNWNMEIVDGKLMCRVCEVALTNGEANIVTHILGTNHITKYIEFLKSNQLEFLNGGFFCTLCLMKVDSKREYFHVSSKRHNKNSMKVGD